MANNYFHFKQFTVFQDKCAMKVCTDACLFGAWVSNKLITENILTDSILDIGTGTGLLSLMLAQQTKAKIDAVEIDEMAAKQAAENFHSSPWANQLKLYHEDIKLFSSSKKYDVIISNPPFFENNLKSNNTAINYALHSEVLNVEQLFENVIQRLYDGGYFFIMLPYSRSKYCISLASTKEFHLCETTTVFQTEKHTSFRTMFMFSKIKQEASNSSIIIMEDRKYSESFTNLLKPYYLKL